MGPAGGDVTEMSLQNEETRTETRRANDRNVTGAPLTYGPV